MKKTHSLLVVLLLLTEMAFGWDIVGLMNVHEPINNKTVDYFVQKIIPAKTLDKDATFQGIAWHSNSDKQIQQDNGGVFRTETFRNWVRIGGVDADVESTHAETIEVPNFGLVRACCMNRLFWLSVQSDIDRLQVFEVTVHEK